MAKRSMKPAGMLPAWERLCFDRELVVAGVQGGCDVPGECRYGHPGCKIKAVSEAGHVDPWKAQRGVSPHVQGYCGVREEDVVERDHLTVAEVRGRHKRQPPAPVRSKHANLWQVVT